MQILCNTSLSEWAPSTLMRLRPFRNADSLFSEWLCKYVQIQKYYSLSLIIHSAADLLGILLICFHLNPWSSVSPAFLCPENACVALIFAYIKALMMLKKAGCTLKHSVYQFMQITVWYITPCLIHTACTIMFLTRHTWIHLTYMSMSHQPLQGAQHRWYLVSKSQCA